MSEGQVAINVPKWVADILNFLGSVPIALAVAISAIFLALVIFTFQLWRFGPSIKKLNSNQVLQQINSAAEYQKTLRDKFDDAEHASKNMMNSANSTLELFRSLQPQIQKMATDMPLLAESVEALRSRLNEIQIDNESQRIDEPLVATANGGNGAQQEDHWETLRIYWSRNTRRLEHVIENIPDRKTRLAIDRMSRTNYRAIVNKLESEEIIKRPEANASRSLIDLFNKYRPRSKKVDLSVVAPLAEADQRLDVAIVPFSQIADADELAPPNPSNHGGGFYSAPPNRASAVPTDNNVAHQRR